MKYLIELVQKEKTDLDKKTVEYVVTWLLKEGHIVYTVEYHYDIYEFFNKALTHYTEIGLQKKCAVQDTMIHFKVSQRHLYRILKSFAKNKSIV